jgi:hypothetical protein
MIMMAAGVRVAVRLLVSDNGAAQPSVRPGGDAQAGRSRQPPRTPPISALPGGPGPKGGPGPGRRGSADAGARLRAVRRPGVRVRRGMCTGRSVRACHRPVSPSGVTVRCHGAFARVRACDEGTF